MGYAAVAFDGTAARRGRHMLHGYPVGSPGALREYWVMHCWVSAENISVPVGELVEALEDELVESACGHQCASSYKRTSRMTTLMNR